MTRLKWLQLTPVVAAMMSFAANAVAADDPQTPPKQVAQATPPPAPAPETTQTPGATPEATPAPQTPVANQLQPPAIPPAAPAPEEEKKEEKLPPGSFKIPGTKTTLTLSGYAQLDTTFDFRGRDPHVEDNDWATHAALIPLNNSYESKEKQNQLYLTARTSRIGISTKTESDIGDIGARVEGDFNIGNLLSGQTFTNSVLFRLRHAYGTISGKYGTLLAGQSWSSFLDMPSYSDVVDFNGPGSIPLIRQPQIRYTAPVGGGVTFTVAAENAPGTDLNGITNGTGGATTTRQQTIPDFVAVLGVSGDWGSASIAGVTMQYKAAKPVTGDGDGYTNQAWGARASAALKLPWGDSLRVHGEGGNGIGRYLFNAGLTGQGAVDTGSSFILWQAAAYHVNYTRVWSPMFRTNLVWSQTYFANNHTVTYAGEKANYEGLNQRIDQVFVNTFITLNKQVEFGFEYIFGERRTFGLDTDTAGQPCGTGPGCQQKGTNHRASVSAHFNFF